MALVSPSTEMMDLSRHIDRSPTGSVADVASEPSSSADIPITTDNPSDQSNYSSPSPNRDVEVQVSLILYCNLTFCFW